jgi:hypothetical protein
MAAFSKYRGLFGAPMAADRAADGVSPVAVDAVTPTYKKPSTGKMILGVLGDTLQQFGGGTGTFLQGQNLQRKAVLDAQARQQEAAGKFAGFKQQYDYELAHPKAPTDDTFTRTLQAAGIDPASPQARQLYMQRAQTLASPAPNFVSDGAGGGRWVQPPAPGMQSVAPQAPIGKLTPLTGGGAPSAGARTFPIR